MTDNITWRALKPKEGDLMSIQKFKKELEHQAFIPGWDGSGKYATEAQVSNKYVPEKPEDLDLSYTHVIWYNN